MWKKIGKHLEKKFENKNWKTKLEKNWRKIGENQAKFIFFNFGAQKSILTPPFTKKKIKKNFGAQKLILTLPPPKKNKKIANDMNITQLPHPIQMALAQKINLIKI